MKALLVSFVALLAISCASVPLSTAKTDRNFNYAGVKTLAVLPFYFSSEDSISDSTSFEISGFWFSSTKTNTRTGVDYSVPDLITMDLFDSRVKILDRNNFENLATEQKINLGQVIQEGSYGTFGSIVKADLMLTGQVTSLRQIGTRKLETSARLVDVASGSVVFTYHGEYGDAWAGLGIPDTFKKSLVKDLLSQLRKVLEL